MPKKRLFMKKPIGIFLSFIIFMIAFGSFMYHSAAAVMKKQLGNQCLGIATAASVLIEQDIESYQTFITTLDTSSAYYQRVKQHLEKIRYANADTIRFLYTEIRISDTEMMYILDGESADDKLFSPPGSTDHLTETRTIAYETESAYIGDSFSSNDYGQLLSAYAPIHDQSGQFIGLVGVDISAEQYQAVMRYQRYIIAGSIVSLTLMMGFLSILLLRVYNAKLQSDQENLSKSTFLARMSHEIRTPMNAIVGMNELLLREPLPPAAREQAISIRQAATSLLAIINDILDFSKIESGKMEVVETPYLFSSLINDVISIIRTRLNDKPAVFVTNIDHTIPNSLIGDEVRLQQILINVLSNAVKYTSDGSISLSVTGTITDEHTVMLTITVTDEGIGIKDKDLEKIFGDFTQVDLKKNKNVEGTGLGLAITYSLCRAMGGDIAVDSHYGQGSTFIITIPQRFEEYVPFAEVTEPGNKNVLLYEPRQAYADSIMKTLDNLQVRGVLVTTHSMFLDELRQKPYTHILVSSFLYGSAKRMLQRLNQDSLLVSLTSYGEPSPEPLCHSLAMPAYALPIANILNGVYDTSAYYDSQDRHARFIAPTARVLIVDDVSTNLKIAEGLLAPLQVIIDCALNGAEALKLVQLYHYDLVLMDHMMPEMDGIEATQAIRSLGQYDKYFETLPIIALTANAVLGVREMFLKNGMNDFLSKPIETLKLYAMMEKWIPKEKQEKIVENSPAPSQEHVEIQGVDTRLGLSLTGGNAENYHYILEIYQKDCLEKIDQIRESLEEEDLSCFTTYVHALKSASASIGAEDVSVAAKKLETAGINKDLAFINQNIGSFLQSLKALSNNITTYLNSDTGNGSDNRSDFDNHQTLVTHLTSLREALLTIDIEAADKAQQDLRAAAWNHNQQSKLEHLYQFILLFEYEKAIAIIDELISS